MRGGVILLDQWHDADWQEPAVTERRAFEMVRAARLETDAIRYFAFPWATLIDRMASRHADEQPLLDALVKMSKTAR